MKYILLSGFLFFKLVILTSEEDKKLEKMKIESNIYFIEKF